MLIESDTSGLEVILVEEGSAVTDDYRLNRVRIYYDKDGNVVGIPCVG
jgi:uncharacterized protein YuzE